MLGQYGLFEEQLSGLKGNERLDKLFYLLTSSKGKQISLSYYLQENWSTTIKELAEKSEETALRKVFELNNTKSKEREFAYDRSIKPCLMIDEENNHSFNFANVEDVANLLKRNDFVSIKNLNLWQNTESYTKNLCMRTLKAKDTMMIVMGFCLLQSILTAMQGTM